MANQFVAVPPDSTGKKVQTFENTVGGNLVEAQAIGLVDQFGVPLATRPDMALRAQPDPTTLLYDTFELLETANTWTTGGTVAPAISAGYLWLMPGTAAGASSTLISKPAFLPGSSAYLQYASLIAFEAAAVPGNQRAWGLGVFGTPTVSAPITNGAVYELDSAAGSLLASVYSAGARTQSVALTRPADGLTHRYSIYYKASRVYFELDNVVVASLAFPNPVVAALSLVLASINGASALATGPTLSTSLIGLGDSARSAHQISDGVFPWREVSVKPASTPAAAADNSLVTTPHPSGAQTVTQGVPAALANAWPVRASDGVNTAGVTARGTQPAFALATQDLRDAGRNVLSLYTAAPVLLTAADALLSLTGFKGGAAVASTTTPAVVSTGKAMRLTVLETTYMAASGTTAGFVRVTLRVNLTGACLITSPAVMSWFVGGPALAVGASSVVPLPLPDGLEFPAGAGLGLSVQGFNATQAATAGLGYVALVSAGFEY